jgi:hypothetical protein
MCALRVLAMIRKIEKRHNTDYGVHFKFSILKQQLDYKTRELISKRWLGEDDLKTLEFSNNHIIYDSKTLKISNDTVANKIISQFCLEREFQTSELIQLLYGCEYNEHSVNRLKVTVSRLNTSIENICGHKRVITVTKNKVILADKIVIKNVS